MGLAGSTGADEVSMGCAATSVPCVASLLLSLGISRAYYIVSLDVQVEYLLHVRSVVLSDRAGGQTGFIAARMHLESHKEQRDMADNCFELDPPRT